MFRTIVVRNERLLQQSARQVNKLNTIRCLSNQCFQKNHPTRSAQTSNFRAQQQPAVWPIGFYRCYADLPDHTKVLLPALSPTMELGTIVSWDKKEGDKLNEGDLLAEIETDKATMGFETPEEGFLAKIMYPAGSKDIPVGKLVCIIVESQDQVAAFKDFKDDGSGAGSAKKATASSPPPAAPAASRPAIDVPDHTKVLLPALSPTMELGTIVSWEKKVGDKLNEGDLLAEIETDKATMGFETPEEGYLAKIMFPAGSKDVPVGKLLCIIVESQDQVAAFKDFTDDGGSAAPAKQSSPQAPAAAAPSPVSSRPAGAMTASEQKFGDRVLASPMAKKLAEQQKLRLEGRGSGLFGSLTSKDLGKLSSSEAKTQAPSASAGAAAAPSIPSMPAGAAYIDIPVSNVRGVIAKRLLESKNSIPHYYLTVDCNIDKIMELRTRFNKSLEKSGKKLSINDFVIKAAATACKKVPECNSAWLGNVIRQFDAVDVSVAVSTENGLITPIVFSADRKGVESISTDVKSLAAKAREGKLQPKEFQGGTFTVSNLGMFDVTHFSAIINPPQSCILAIGGSQKRLVIDESSEKGFKEATFMSVTLSADHRTVDGAVGARWLQYFRKYMEDPATMLL